MIGRVLAPWRELGGGGRAALVLLLAAALALNLWYALFWPEEGRFYDEQYNVRNVAALVSGRAPEGMNGFYPALTWAPQAALLEAMERLAPLVGARFVASQDVRLTPAGLRVARATHVLTGTATLFALFLLAARLFDPATALAATALLAVSPWHLHASAYFKPDASLALAWALAALAITDAAIAPSRAGYLGMAATIACAFSCKQTGVALAVPAAIVVLAQLRRPEVLRRWVPAATGLGALLIVALNATQLLFPEDLETIFRFYSNRERHAGASPGAALTQLVEWLRDWTTFGAGVAALAALGLLLWAGIALRDLRHREPLALARAVALLTPFAFVGVYLAVTSHFKTNNFVPLLQSLAVAAALPAGRLVAALAARRPRAGRAALLAPLALALLARGGTGFEYVHHSVTPTTLDVLLRQAAEQGLVPAHKVVLSEWRDAGRVRWERERDKVAGFSVVVDVPRLAELAPERRRRADGGIRLATSPAPPNEPPGEVLRVAPRWLRVRGPALVAHFHRWGEPEELVGYDHKALGQNRWEEKVLPLPEAPAPGEHLQLVAWLRRYPFDPYSPPHITVDGEAISASQGLDRGDGELWSTERFAVGAMPPVIRFDFPDDRFRPEWAVTIFRWRGAPVE